MKGRKHTPEQIVRKLREADRLLGEGKLVAEVAKELGISEHTFGRWRNQYGGMKADDAKELRRLKDENGRLKRMVADQALDIEILKEVARENSEPDPPTRRRSPCPRATGSLGAQGVPGDWAEPKHPTATSATGAGARAAAAMAAA